MSSVNVLCPNGRRQAVKVTPNTTILQLLEEVCLKRGFDAAKHDLKHGRTTLDITSTFRFSGIPNNAKLELVEREKPRSLITDITIALQLENGDRRQKTMSCDSTLADMIRMFSLEKEDLLDNTTDHTLQPVIINMREEIIGLYALENTTLKSIGLVSGRVALRLVHRSVEPSVLQQIEMQINADKAKQQKLALSVNKAISTSEQLSATVPPARSLQRLEEETESMDTTEQTAGGALCSMPVATGAPTDAMPVTTPVINNAAVSSSVSDVPDSSVTSTDAITSISKREAAVELLYPPDSHNETEQSTRVKQPRSVRPYRPQQQTIIQEFKFPEETAGQSLYQNELSEVKPEEYLPCERELTVFSMEESRAGHVSPGTDEDLPDSFFEVTKNDLQSMIKSLRDQALTYQSALVIGRIGMLPTYPPRGRAVAGKSEACESDRLPEQTDRKESDDSPLMTSSMRQARMEANFSMYKHAVIRFNFPDKMVLQARFRPRETVHSLRKFVRSHLIDCWKSFHIYTTPPKKVLSDSASTLIQAFLVPMAIVYVSIDNYKFTDSCLCEETRALKVTKDDADSCAISSLPANKQLSTDLSNKPGVSSQTASASAASTSSGVMGNNPRRSNTSSSAGGNRSASTTGNVPKWYKPSGK